MNIEHRGLDSEQAEAELERHSPAFEKLAQMLVEHNRRTNLTRITEPDQIRIRHFLDSLIALEAIDKLAAGAGDFCLADIGSGAGFPSLPLAIARPGWRIVSIEATGKKADFQRLVAEALDLKNFDIVIGRAEELARLPQYREKFDVVCARAVAKLRILAETAVGLVKIGGSLLVWQSADAENELKENLPTITKMGVVPQEILSYSLAGMQRFLLVHFNKAAGTDARLPRRYSTMLKRAF